MKSYNHLWEKYISDENIDLAIKNAAKYKHKKPSVKRCLENPNFHDEIKNYAMNFHNAHHTPKEIYDGIRRKKRTIIVPNFYEQVVHHMIVNTMMPIFMHGMYEHSYGSIPKRGAHKGKKTVERWIRNGGKDCKYCLKMDIRKYFDSIPHEILLCKLRKVIRDDRFMAVMEEIVSVLPKGIPLGFYLSQWLANWYLQDLDHYIKEVLHAKFYIRYMDDMVIFGGNKRVLHDMRKGIEIYLKDRLGLDLKDNWQVFRFNYKERFRFLDFIGFRFYRNRTTLRRSIALRATRKAMKLYKKEVKTVFDIRQMLSYMGWLDCTDTYRFYEERIKPYVNIQYMKRRISNYDKRRVA